MQAAKIDGSWRLTRCVAAAKSSCGAPLATSSGAMSAPSRSNCAKGESATRESRHLVASQAREDAERNECEPRALRIAKSTVSAAAQRRRRHLRPGRTGEWCITDAFDFTISERFTVDDDDNGRTHRRVDARATARQRRAQTSSQRAVCRSAHPIAALYVVLFVFCVIDLCSPFSIVLFVTCGAGNELRLRAMSAPIDGVNVSNTRCAIR